MSLCIFLNSNEITSFKLRAGSNYWFGGGTLHQIKQIFKHETVDVVLFLVEDRFNFEITNARPVALPAENEETETGSPLTVTGWGTTEVSKNSIAELINLANNKVIKLALTT